MKWITLLLAGLLVVAFNNSPGWCHGVMGSVNKIEAYCVTAMYDDGEPMSYAKVDITAPETDLPFQSGRTDRNGNFVINTDTPGTWKAVVSDGMGHRLALDFQGTNFQSNKDHQGGQGPAKVSQGNGQASEQNAVSSLPDKRDRFLKVICGLSLIIGVWGFFFGWKARRGTIRGRSGN